MLRSAMTMTHLFAIFLFFTISHSQAQSISTSATTGVVINQLLGRISEIIESTIEDGDYLLASAALEAKNTIEAWKAVNEDLLDQAFSELDAASQDAFRQAAALLDRTKIDADELISDAKHISDTLAQAVNDLPGNRNTYILRYQPRVIAFAKDQPLPLRINGIGFDNADPKLFFKEKLVPLITHTQSEIEFLLTRQQNSGFDSFSLQSLTLKYTVPHRNWFWRVLGYREERQRDISVAVLPRNFGEYTYTRIDRVRNRETRNHTADLGQFKGTNTRKYKVANPPHGWRWDINQGRNAFKLDQGKGEEGRCEKIVWNGASPNGIRMFARLDQIRKGLSRKDGYVNCELKGPIYRVVERDHSIEPMKGSIDWFEDVRLPKKKNTRRFSLEIRVFDGRTVEVQGERSERTFRVRDGEGAVIIEPRVPEDLL